jgi:hypothetical protein
LRGAGGSTCPAEKSILGRIVASREYLFDSIDEARQAFRVRCRCLLD